MTNRISRRFMAAAAGVTPVAALIGTAHAQAANESTFERINRTKTMRISNSKCLPLAMSSHCDLGCDVGRWF